jgi:hypothetical protein
VPVTIPPYAAEIRLECREASRGWRLYYRALDDAGKAVYAESADTEADARPLLDFPIGGLSPPEGRLARGFKPPAFSRFLFQSVVKLSP